jgi:hypothetical protein
MSGCMQALPGTLQQHPVLLPPGAPPLLQQQQQFQPLQEALYAVPSQQHGLAAWQPVHPGQPAALPAFQSSRQQGMSHQDQVLSSWGAETAVTYSSPGARWNTRQRVLALLLMKPPISTSQAGSQWRVAVLA